MPESSISHEQIEQLQQRLTKLDKRLNRLTSFRYLFSFAVVQGIGYVLGATMVASVVAAIVLRLLAPFGSVPYFNEMFDTQQLQDTLSGE